MTSFFPKYFSDRAILLYVVLLVLVSLAFGYPMPWYWWLFGIAEVAIFFYYSNQLTKAWGGLGGKPMEHKLFYTSLVIRLLYVVISYALFYMMTGSPFEFNAGDALWYHDMAMLGSDIVWGADIKWSVFFDGAELTDLGYPIYLSAIYALTGRSILIARLIKAFISAWTVVLMYRFATRNFGEEVGHLTAVFCMLMPNLIYYCGMHLKETEMLFLVVAFFDKADIVFRSRRAKFDDVFWMFIIGVAVYFFRGVLSALLFLSLATTIVLGSARIKKGGKWAIEGLLLILLGGVVLWNITAENLGSGEYSNIQEQQDANMQWRAEREGGNAFAVNAGSVVFAPLIFTIPFPTLVNIEYQQDQQMINGGNYVKNIMSFFTILALLLLLLSGKWRDNLLPIAFTVGYLIVLVFSNYAQSERFHIPSLPFELMFAAYGVSVFKTKQKNWFILWLIFIFVANIGWAWFKLRGRGM